MSKFLLRNLQSTNVSKKFLRYDKVSFVIFAALIETHFRVRILKNNADKVHDQKRIWFAQDPYWQF